MLKKLLLFVPFLLICAFAALAFFRVQSEQNGETADIIPSALQNKRAPRLYLPALNPPDSAETAEERPAPPTIFDSEKFKGRVTLVNFWGSWCPPCRAEHAFLMSLAHNPAFDLVGVNYKDNKENALRFLGAFGNPFSMTGFDRSGRAAIDWGVYGPPESFLLDKNGIILYRFIGPLTAESFQKTLWPIITRANEQS